jgi:hypothetical protein
MDKNTKLLNQRWEALRERIKELATEPKLNYNTNKGDTKMKTLKPVTERLVKQLEQEIVNLNAECDEALANYTPNYELDWDNSDAIFYSYEDQINWVKSFINELTGDK